MNDAWADVRQIATAEVLKLKDKPPVVGEAVFNFDLYGVHLAGP